MIISKRSTGFTLIEVLVALLVLAIGLLGIAALQFQGLRYSNDALIRTQINFLVYDIAERMRENNQLAGAYTKTYTVPDNPGQNTCIRATGVTSTADAANNLNCWLNQVDLAIPPQSQVEINNNGDLYNVRFQWQDREGQVRDINYTFRP